MNVIINIEDPVLGSWHQITVEGTEIRLDGTTLPAYFTTHKAILALQAEFNDEFAGIIDGKDTYLADVLADDQAEGRERNNES